MFGQTKGGYLLWIPDLRVFEKTGSFPKLLFHFYRRSQGEGVSNVFRAELDA